MKNLAILGSTGSIGRQTLDVCRWFKNDFNVLSLVAFSNIDLITEQVKEFNPQMVVIVDETKYSELKRCLAEIGFKGEVKTGTEAVIEASLIAEVDMVVAGISGVAGLLPVVEAIKSGKDIALANKEVLVAAGDLVMDLVAKHQVKMLPVDSEHSAIWQCLPKDGSGGVENIILTASGGPFKYSTLEEIKKVTPEQALNHPTWSMGPKITIDSATLMNKGLEVIEAHHLFKTPYENIDVVIHPESIIHSMVQYEDSAVLAHMGYADMRVPIQLALTYPNRAKNALPRMNFPKLAGLSFLEPDYSRFPCLKLAIEAGKKGGSYPVVLNGANEVLVWRFINGEIDFWQIPMGVEKVLSQHQGIEKPNLDTILEVDLWSRAKAREI